MTKECQASCQAPEEQTELQTNGPLEGTGRGLEVALALLSLYSPVLLQATHLPSLGQSFFEGSLGPLE